MDFRHLVASPESLSKVDADALILIVQGSAVDAALEAPLAALIDDAVKAGDFELKSGRTLYVHRPTAMKVARLMVVAAAATGGLKAFKAAVALGLGQLKSSGARHIAVAMGDTTALTSLHAQVLATSAAEAVYMYRHSKPSAPAASALAVC